MMPATLQSQLLAAAVPPMVEAALFYLFAGLTAGSALAVVASRNIVRMSVALLFALIGVAGIFFLLQAEFLAAVQLVVYVGGTLILIVFGVMLTSKSPFTKLEPTRAEVAVAFTLAVLLVLTLTIARPNTSAQATIAPSAVPQFLTSGERIHGVRFDASANVLQTDRKLEEATRKTLIDHSASDSKLSAEADRAAFIQAIDQLAKASAGLPAKHELAVDGRYPIAGLGIALLGDYLLPFELVSVLLLAVMIGAAYLAKGRRREAATA